MTVDTVGQSSFEPGICMNLTCGIAVIANVEKWFEVQVAFIRYIPPAQPVVLSVGGNETYVQLECSF
jgi:hypothetical protein